MLTLLLITGTLFAGLMMTRLTDFFKLPDVTAYLIVGVIIGPSVLGKFGIDGFGFVSFEEVQSLSIISDVALGFIAFSIGNEFEISNLKKIGRQAFIIGILQAVITTIVVDLILCIVHIYKPSLVTIPVAITLGAIAAATAPAATLMVVRQYKAEGEVTDILLPVVALDDAVGLMIFAVSFGAAQSMEAGNSNIANFVVEPLLEIVFSLCLGVLVALVLTHLAVYFHSNMNKLILIIASIILTVAISKVSFVINDFKVSFSPLLVCMMLGTVFCNICETADELIDRANRWGTPLIVLFFVLSGAELDLSILGYSEVIIVGIIYILARSFGKYFGARISAKIAGSSESVKKYLGITLLPQAGVALGMSSLVANSFGESGVIIRNIVLFGVLIYELIGPTLTKVALIKAGDIKNKNG